MASGYGASQYGSGSRSGEGGGRDEGPKPQYSNEKLGLQAELTKDFPDLAHAEYVAKGGEAEVYKIQVRDDSLDSGGYRSYGAYHDTYTPRAVKVFHKAEFEPGDLEGEVMALTTPIMAVATNARWADRVYNPQGVLAVLNKNQCRLEQLGLEQDYTLRTLRGTYIDFRGLNHRGIVLATVRMFEEKGLPVPDDLAKLYKEGGSYVPPTDAQGNITFKGGLAKYINGVTAYLGRKYPQLELPVRIFPRIDTFGFISGRDSRVDPYGKFEQRMAMVMEWVPDNLEAVIKRGYEQFTQHNGSYGYRDRGEGTYYTGSSSPYYGSAPRAGEDDPSLRLIKGMANYLKEYAPLEELKRVRTTLAVLGGFDLAFGDLKPENIGIVEGRSGRKEVVLLDPGTAVKKGSIQDFATEDYLPNEPVALDGRMRNPRAEFADGELRAHPWFDQVALYKMINDLVSGGIDAAVQSMEDSYKAAQHEQGVRRATQRALKNLEGRRGF